MSVSEAVGYDRHDWQGFDDPRLPVAAWFAQGTLTGDASGGARLIDIRFRNTGDPLSALTFSLERLSLLDTNDSSKNAQIFTSGFILLQNYFMSLTSSGGGSFASISVDRLSGFPLFLGTLSPVAGGQSALSIQTTNVDLADFIIRAEGWLWSQRTKSQLGGFMRPVGGPWG